jgi:hypothetical protein
LSKYLVDKKCWIPIFSLSKLNWVLYSTCKEPASVKFS